MITESQRLQQQASKVHNFDSPFIASNRASWASLETKVRRAAPRGTLEVWVSFGISLEGHKRLGIGIKLVSVWRLSPENAGVNVVGSCKRWGTSLTVAR